MADAHIAVENVTSTVLTPYIEYTIINDGQKKAFAGVGVLCLVMVLAASVFKALTSRRQGEKTRGQDWTFGAATVLYVAFVLASISMLAFGDAENYVAYADSSAASTAFYATSLAMLRIAVLCLFQDALFHGAQYWKLSIFLATTFSTYTLLFILIDAFQCRPLPIHDPEHNCVNTPAVEIAFGIIDFIVNVTILSMPVKALWLGRAHRDVKNLWCYPIAFVLGLLACIFSLIHAIAPVTASTTRGLLYPMTGLLTLTLMFLAFAIVLIPAFARSRTGPIQSPTTTHPHLHNRSASVLSWIPGYKNPNSDDSHNDRSDSTDISVKGVSTDLEKSTEALMKSSEALPTPVSLNKSSTTDDLDGRTLDGRTNSLRSFSRLGSLTGAVKPPSFLANRPGRTAHRHERPGDLDVNGIKVSTKVEMSYEERQRRKSQNASHNSSPSGSDRKRDVYY